MNITHAAAIVLQRPDGTILAQERPRKARIMPGYWEFPGGKLENDETAKAAAIRELQEELGITANQLQALYTIDETRNPEHADAYRVIVEVFLCTEWAGEPIAHDGQIFEWLSPAALAKRNLLPANYPILELL